MARYCCLCNKKAGFPIGWYSAMGQEDKPLCTSCYTTYNDLLNKINDDCFESELAQFKNNCTKKEVIEEISDYLINLRKRSSKKTSPKNDNKVNINIGPFENQDLVYTIDGVRGRHIDIYRDKAIFKTRVTLGSLLTQNATDGEKTIYYSDCIGLQYKQAKFTIGYLQFETATNNGNNQHSNFWAENSFTFDTSVISNEEMDDVVEFVKSRIDAIKKSSNTPEATDNKTTFVADEILKLKQLVDMGILSQEEFDQQKIKLLNK